MLQDKVTFITGSTRGIGWATAREFARHGATVILNHRGGTDAVLDERCRELEAEFHGTVIGLAADVTESPAVRNCYAEIFRRFKRLDVLVNNAGILQDALLGMITNETMRAVMDTNVIGSLGHLQEASRLMARNRRGSIINVSSIIGRFGNDGQTVYAASKAAVIGMTMAAAKELAPQNIRVNAVSAGPIKTLAAAGVSGFSSILQVYRDRAPLRRNVELGEVADAALFLLGPASRGITGEVMMVDVGYHAVGM